jgi:predicted HTH transcriptional regulator
MHPLKSTIANGEGQKLEFKFELNDARKIAQTLSAFSNADGGTILVGVKDNGQIAGIRYDEEYYVLDAAATMYCKPPVNLEHRTFQLDNKTVLEVKIKSVENKPVYAEIASGQWIAFLRSGAANFKVTPVHLELMKSAGKSNPPPAVFTEKQQNILHLLNENDKLTLNQLCKLSKLQRPIVIKTLADFYRWEILQIIEGADGYKFKSIQSSSNFLTNTLNE